MRYTIRSGMYVGIYYYGVGYDTIGGEFSTTIIPLTNLCDYCQKIHSNFKQRNSHKIAFTIVYT